jgi:UDP-hydrolysing UDP-N-acetyl-D-glucosamine 2-epimerase
VFESAEDLELQLVVTGMHLSPEFGLTYQQIEADGFSITRKIEMSLSCDSAAGIAKSTGLGLIGFGDAFESLKPDLVVMLGDRFELLAAASAALFATLPIAHIHGGEVTTGAFDEAIRHSITKMSHLHFTSTETYRQRVIQLGEHPNRVFDVGAPGLDNLDRLELLHRVALEQAIGLILGDRSLLVTWHPVTVEPGKTRKNFQALLNALEKLDDVRLIFTKANADTQGGVINRMIDDYVAARGAKTVVHTSLGQLRYRSTLKHVDGVVGNSSSGTRTQAWCLYEATGRVAHHPIHMLEGRTITQLPKRRMHNCLGSSRCHIIVDHSVNDSSLCISVRFGENQPHII